jgi:hypothetical protein
MTQHKVLDWNEQEHIALVRPGIYVRLDSFDVKNLTPVRQVYLRQYHYVATVRDHVAGLLITGRSVIPGDWHGGIRPWDVEGGDA